MSIERTFDLIINAGTSSPLVINANQNDSGEIWKFNLYQEDGTKVIPAAGEIVGLKSDGHAIVNAGTVNESGQVVITETAQITAAVGANVFEIVFDSVHGTANFILYVEKSPVDDDADFSESDISAIQQAIAMAIDAQTVAALQAGLAQESTTRAAQDAQLAGDISEEAATRASADAVLRQAIDDAAIVPAGSTVVVDNTLSIAGAAADAKKTGDAVSDLNQNLSVVNERLATTLQRFGYVINDAWLTANNISDVKQLTKNRVYLLAGVTKTNLTSMPITSGTSYNGALVIFDQVSPGMTPLLFFDNVGKLYSGVNIESSIRWIENATSANISALIASIQSLETSSLRTFGTQITDSWLSANNKDDVMDLTVNYCYIINNVTKTNLANMPEISATAYNGALLYFRQQSPAFQPLFFIDNLGNCWSGIDTGTTIRWKSLTQTYQTINDALYRFYNKKILILGDSIVYGNHMTDYQAGNRTVVTLDDETVYKNNLSTTVWSYKFAQYITANYGMTVVNNAYPGARFQDIITYYDQLIDDTYDFVLICMGVNNWNSGGQVIPALTTLKSRFDAMGAKMLVMTPLGSTTYALATGMIRGFIKEWGLNASKEVGDLYSNFNEINYLQGHTLSDVLLDGVHYNDASQTDIFEAVKKTLNL